MKRTLTFSGNYKTKAGALRRLRQLAGEQFAVETPETAHVDALLRIMPHSGEAVQNPDGTWTFRVFYTLEELTMPALDKDGRLVEVPFKPKEENPEKMESERIRAGHRLAEIFSMLDSIQSDFDFLCNTIQKEAERATAQLIGEEITQKPYEPRSDEHPWE